MSKKPFDFLVTDKEPLVYIEKTMVRMNDGFLTLLRGEQGKEVLAPASHLVMMLGAGTSISQEAAIFCSLNDLHVSFARGGTNIHSMFMSGRYQSPESVMNQASLIAEHKFKVAKLLMRYRLERHGCPLDIIEDMLSTKDLVSLVAWEGRYAIAEYKKFALKSKVTFTRDFDGKDSINEKLNVLNNALYSVCTAICLSCGLHPSLGFIHGYTRRGGFAFDLADIFKKETTLPLAFDPKTIGAKAAMYRLSHKLKDHNSEIIKQMVKLCLLLGTGTYAQLEDYFANPGR